MAHAGELLEAVREAGLPPNMGIAQIATPNSGDNVQMINTPQSGLLRIQGAAPLASLSITHPDPANSINSQVRSVFFEVDIASISWPGSSGTNLPTSALQGDSCTTQRLEPGVWSRRY
jgi:hypothetical protein